MLLPKKYFFVLFVLVGSYVFSQEIDFSATVSKSELGLNQRLKIEFSVNKNGGDNFEAPDFSNFKVIAGPSSSVSQSWINGKSSYSQSYIYILEPKNVGVFTIPPAQIEYKKTIISSNSVTVVVTEEVALPKDPNDPNYIAQENISLVATVSKTRPYVGESVYVEYRLYFSKKVGFSSPQFGENPKYEGFWNQEIPIKQQEERIGELNGKKYRYYVLKKTVLIPQKTGKLYVDPMDMDLVVNVPTGRYDFFGNAQTRKVNAHYTSGRKLIHVKSLPIEGKPVGFNGAVGKYDLKVTASKNVLKANEATQIDVNVSGKGNLKLFEIPSLVVPAELEVYTPERNQKLRTTLSGLKGTISDSYSIVPEYKGKYIIPSLQFSYFDPADEQYHLQTSDEIIVEVTEGKPIPSTTTGQIANKEVVTNTGGDFRFIHTQTEFKTAKNKDFYASKLYYLLLLLPFIAIPVGILFGYNRKKILTDVMGNKIRIADRLAKKYLSEAKKQLKNKEAFYIALEKALHNFLKAKLHIETADISQEKIAQLLADHKVSESTIEFFTDVLVDCNFARYTPTTTVMMKNVYKKASKAINGVNSELQQT